MLTDCTDDYDQDTDCKDECEKDMNCKDECEKGMDCKDDDNEKPPQTSAPSLRGQCSPLWTCEQSRYKKVKIEMTSIIMMMMSTLVIMVVIKARGSLLLNSWIVVTI